MIKYGHSTKGHSTNRGPNETSNNQIWDVPISSFFLYILLNIT